MDAKRPGDLVYVLGITRDELGASEWFAHNGLIGSNVPKVDGPAAMKLYKAVSEAIKQGLIASCHDCSDGGLGVALAETAFSGGLGVTADLSLVPYEGVTRDDYVLFSESQSRFVVTVRPEAQGAFEKVLKGNVKACIGVVTAEPLFRIKGVSGNNIIEEKTAELKEAWRRPLAF
jgi:phosphoribosylformylglycinamidine synthase